VKVIGFESGTEPLVSVTVPASTAPRVHKLLVYTVYVTVPVGAALVLAFDRAAAMTVDATGDTPYLALGDAHLARWRGDALARIGHPEALDCLNVALREMDSSFRRATASLHCDLAIAHLRSGDRDAAFHFASTARSIAGEVGSVRQLRRVERLRIAA